MDYSLQAGVRKHASPVIADLVGRVKVVAAYYELASVVVSYRG